MKLAINEKEVEKIKLNIDKTEDLIHLKLIKRQKNPTEGEMKGTEIINKAIEERQMKLKESSDRTDNLKEFQIFTETYLNEEQSEIEQLKKDIETMEEAKQVFADKIKTKQTTKTRKQTTLLT